MEQEVLLITNKILKKVSSIFESRTKKFVRLSKELLRSGNCSAETEMILQIGIRKVEVENIWVQEVIRYVLSNFTQILLSPNKKLSEDEIKFLHKLDLWVGGKYKAGSNLNLSFDALKKDVADAERDSAKEDNPYGTGGTPSD